MDGQTQRACKWFKSLVGSKPLRDLCLARDMALSDLDDDKDGRLIHHIGRRLQAARESSCPESSSMVFRRDTCKVLYLSANKSVPQRLGRGGGHG